MSELKDVTHESNCISNAKSIVIIIQKIQKDPIAEARTLINERSVDSRVTNPALRRIDPVSLSTNILPILMAIRLNDTGSNSASRLPHLHASPESQEIPTHTNANALRVHQRDRQTIIRDYGDDSREIYEPGSSSSSIQGHDRHNHSMFVPVPPFIVSDRQNVHRRRRDSGEQP
jgi:hypothetical protein